MTRISQLIAVAGGIKVQAEAQAGHLVRVAKTPDLFKGHERTYRPLAEDGVQEPPQSLKVRATAAEVLSMTRTGMTRQWDVARTLDEANAGAFADVKVNGAVLLERVPVSHLLWLARELGTLQGVIAALPVLDGSRDWHDAGHGLSRTDPVETTKGEKVPYSFEVAKPTQYHPGQYQVMTKDEVIGFWSTVTFSGALSQERKQELLDRVAELLNAVKMAREEANSVQVEDKHEGAVLFDWLLRP
jgi:hypothetical protein